MLGLKVQAVYTMDDGGYRAVTEKIFAQGGNLILVHRQIVLEYFEEIELLSQY